MGAEEEQCVIQLVFTESSRGATGKMGQNTRGGFESQRLRSTSLEVSRRNQVPGIMGKLVGGLKRTFRVKMLVFVSTKALQTVKEGKKVMEKDVCGGVSVAVQSEKKQPSLLWAEKRPVHVGRGMFGGMDLQDESGRAQGGFNGETSS